MAYQIEYKKRIDKKIVMLFDYGIMMVEKLKWKVRYGR